MYACMHACMRSRTHVQMAPGNVLGAVSLIMLGTLMAGFNTLSANLFGYFFVMMNNVLTAVLYTEVRSWRTNACASDCRPVT
jgi:hypothetical protein